MMLKLSEALWKGRAKKGHDKNASQVKEVPLQRGYAFDAWRLAEEKEKAPSPKKTAPKKGGCIFSY